MPSFCNLGNRHGGQSLIRLAALLLAFAVAQMVAFARERDQDNGRDIANAVDFPGKLMIGFGVSI
jgi:hypothetical protein